MGLALISEPICLPDAMQGCDQNPKAIDSSIESSQKEYGRTDIITRGGIPTTKLHRYMSKFESVHSSHSFHIICFQMKFEELQYHHFHATKLYHDQSNSVATVHVLLKRL